MDERKAANRHRARGDEWRLDPSDVQYHRRRIREARRGGWLGKSLVYGAAALVLGGAGYAYWHRDSLQGVTVDLSAFTRLFGGAAAAVAGSRTTLFGGEPETQAVEGAGVVGTEAATSLDGSAPPPESAPATAAAADSAAVAAARGFAPPEPAAGEAIAVAGRDAVSGAAAGPTVVARVDPPPPPPPEPEAPVGPETFGFAANSFEVTIIEVSEADANVAVIVGRSGGRRAATSITWWTTDGSATGGKDYADRGRLVEKFAAGEQNRTLRVPIIGDKTLEGPETLYVHFAPNDADGTPRAADAQMIEVMVKDDD